MVEPGTILVEKYRIEHVLARGGMGVVARAHHLILDVPVAIKFLLPEALEQEEIVQRFLREAQAAAKLKSEHVSRIIDVGLLDTGAPYLVMEYLEGIDLKDLLRQRGRLDPGFAVDLALQACEALAEAHAVGIVHRDIKPSNFFLTQGADGAPLLKLLDFGVSKASSTMIKGITKSQVIIGTPAYMSPEQMASSKDVDARSDIWSLGVLLYELVSRRRPFRGENYGSLVVRVTTQPMAPLDDVELPDGLADVIAGCLQKEASRRFQTTAELAAALAPYAGTPSQATRSTERTLRVLELATSSGVVSRHASETHATRDPIRDTGNSTIRVSAGERTAEMLTRALRSGARGAAAAADPEATSATTARRERPRRRFRPLVAATVAAVLGMAAALVAVMQSRPAIGPAAGPATAPAPAAEPAPAPAVEPATAPASGSGSHTAPDDVAVNTPPAAAEHALAVDAGAPPVDEAQAEPSPAAPPAPDRAERPRRRNRRKSSTGAADQSTIEDAFGTRN
jgi:serine/threonine protein kinase